MAFDGITLSGYVSSPDDFAVFPPVSERVIGRVLKMLSPYYAPITLKMRMMNGIKDAIVEDGITPEFDIRLIKSLKPAAYMIDGGDAYFSIGLLALKSPLATLTVCLHELSHVILSRMEGYSSLKAVQREFRTSYGAHPSFDIMSPIELYADLIAISILECAYKATKKKKEKKRLLRAITHRREKLAAARSALKTITTPIN